MAQQERQYEIVLFGATGYTGKLAAEHITKSLPTDLRWALAGRSAPKLEAVANTVRALNPDRVQPGIEVAQLSSEDLDVLSRKTRLIINTAGPYSLYGTPVVEACAKNGTHYVDVTGETPWVAEMVEKYHDVAKANGAIIIPQLGLESAPADLVSWMLVNLLKKEYSLPTKDIIFSMHEVLGSLSGGTINTIFTIMEKYGLRGMARASNPWILSPVKGTTQRNPAGLLGVRRVPELGILTSHVASPVDASIVNRSWYLLGDKILYGPKFHFREYLRASNYVFGVFIHLGIVLLPFVLALAPIRWLLKKILPGPGSGPERSAADKEKVEYRAIAVADEDSASPHRAYGTMRYQGGIYYLSGLFMVEAAAVILRGPEDIAAKRLKGGILTPATLGQPFFDRLEDAGVHFEAKVLPK